MRDTLFEGGTRLLIVLYQVVQQKRYKIVGQTGETSRWRGREDVDS